jgi:hypothetical protein
MAERISMEQEEAAFTFGKLLTNIDKSWNEEDHPRVPAGESGGGQFTSGGGGGGGSAEGDKFPPWTGPEAIDTSEPVDEHGLTLDEQSTVEHWLGMGYRELRTDPEFGKILEKFPLVTGKVWRGGGLPSETLNSLKVGDIYEINKFSSSSQDFNVAERFAAGIDKPGRERVMFEVFDQGRKIPRDYTLPAGTEEEREVVLMTGDAYRITKIDRNKEAGGLPATWITMKHV